MTHKFRATFLGMGTLALAACQTPPALDVERQWTDTMQRLNVFGFYPITEDVQVGDVFLHVPPRDGGPSLSRFSLLKMGSYLGKDVETELLRQQVENRLRIEPLPVAAQPQGSGSTPTREPATAIARTSACDDYDIGHADAEGCPKRLRLQRAAIPALAVGRITNAQLGAAGAYGNVGARLGIGSNSQTAVSISLRNLQEMTLDAWRISRLRNEHEQGLLNLLRAEDLLFYLRQLDATLLADACNGRADRLANRRVEVLVVNRVIYAGGIEYNFTRNAEAALRATVDLQSILPGQLQAPVVPSLPATSGTTAPSTTAADATASGQRLAALMQAVTGETGNGARLGVTTSFGMGMFGSLSLKQDFNRAIAVGAGARIRLSFHEMLAGLPGLEKDGGLLAEFRYGKAKEQCQRALGSAFDSARLRAAMGLPAA